MFRLLCSVFVVALVISLLGCGGGKKDTGGGIPGIKTEPGKTGQATPETPKKPEPSPAEKWLADTCGKCHEQGTLKDLKDKVMAMTSADLEAALRTKCLAAVKDHPGVTFGEAEIAKALEIHKAATEKQGEKPSPASNAAPTGGQ